MCDLYRCRRLKQRAAYWQQQRGGAETARTIERELSKECPHKSGSTKARGARQENEK